MSSCTGRKEPISCNLQTSSLIALKFSVQISLLFYNWYSLVRLFVADLFGNAVTCILDHFGDLSLDGSLERSWSLRKSIRNYWPNWQISGSVLSKNSVVMCLWIQQVKKKAGLQFPYQNPFTALQKSVRQLIVQSWSWWSVFTVVPLSSG